jgi:hypothetical protein
VGGGNIFRSNVLHCNMLDRYSAASAIQCHVSTAATQLTQTS